MSLAGVEFFSRRQANETRAVATFVQGMPEYFDCVLEQAGRVDVRFGAAPGGQPGAWDPTQRRVTLDLDHPNVLAVNDIRRVQATAVFEIINASSDFARDSIEDAARSGAYEQEATGQGHTGANVREVGAQLYGRAMDQLEFRSLHFHQQMMEDRGYASSNANLFRGTTHDFEAHYQFQRQTGHTASYEDHYRTWLRPRPYQPESSNPVAFAAGISNHQASVQSDRRSASYNPPSASQYGRARRR